MSARTSWLVVALVAWTLFVWIGRIRNALADVGSDSGERVGPVLLATSFVIVAVVLAVLCIARRRRGSDRVARAFTTALVGFAVWTTVVWVLRAGDIVLGGDHDAAFVLVHVALGGVSIALAVLAALSDSIDHRVSTAGSRPTPG